jgi:hypothetical protein
LVICIFQLLYSWRFVRKQLQFFLNGLSPTCWDSCLSVFFLGLCSLFDFCINNYFCDKLCFFNCGCQVIKVNVQKGDHSHSVKMV